MQAAGNMADPRYHRPAVTGVDALHLLYATVKKHRFLANMTATCDASSVEGKYTQDLHVTLRLR